MKKLIHTITYKNKSIPVTYDPDEVKSRLLEVTAIIDKSLEYLKSNNISLTDEQKKLIVAEECISTSYIEGYETWLSSKYLVEGYTTNELADKATLACFNAYNFAIAKYLDIGIKNTSDILDIWKQLVKYKIFFRKNIRNIGVRVGNRFSTSHIAPPASCVRKLLDEMFSCLEAFDTMQEDKYSLLKPIIMHYIYTFIHPFLDGNGRTARLFEQLMILNSNRETGLDFMVPLSTVILEDKRAYYNTFKSGQTFGEDCTDVLSSDITDFINYNLYTLESGLLCVMRELNSSFNTEVNIEKIECYKNDVNQIKRNSILSSEGIEYLVDALLNEQVYYLDETCITIGDHGYTGAKKHRTILNPTIEEWEA